MGAFRGFASSFPGAITSGFIQLTADVTLAAGVNTEMTQFRSPLVVRDSGVYLLFPVGQALWLAGASPPTSLVFSLQAGSTPGGTQFGTSTSSQANTSQLTANALWTQSWGGSITLNAIAGQTINCSMIGNSAAQAATAKGSASYLAWMLVRQQD